jgi:hypothetical protein
MLMSKEFSYNDMKAALAEKDAPECPSDFSEPRWANLLFGEGVCQVSPMRTVGILVLNR